MFLFEFSRERKSPLHFGLAADGDLCQRKSRRFGISIFGALSRGPEICKLFFRSVCRTVKEKGECLCNNPQSVPRSTDERSFRKSDLETCDYIQAMIISQCHYQNLTLSSHDHLVDHAATLEAYRMTMKIVAALVAILWITHMLTCGWFLIGRLDLTDTGAAHACIASKINTCKLHGYFLSILADPTIFVVVGA